MHLKLENFDVTNFKFKIFRCITEFRYAKVAKNDNVNINVINLSRFYSFSWGGEGYMFV